VDEPCTMYHTCAVSDCRLMTLCETFKETCPWRAAERYDLDPLLAGAICLGCMRKLMENMQRRVDTLLGNNDNEADGA
jgi:hypothetical protein